MTYKVWFEKVDLERDIELRKWQWFWFRKWQWNEITVQRLNLYRCVCQRNHETKSLSVSNFITKKSEILPFLEFFGKKFETDPLQHFLDSYEWFSKLFFFWQMSRDIGLTANEPWTSFKFVVPLWTSCDFVDLVKNRWTNFRRC